MFHRSIGPILLITTILWIVGTMAALPSIVSWEARNNYPYGRMCDPNVFNGWQSTCH